MDYAEIKQQLVRLGFERVERDDVLLDMFPNQHRAHGKELWIRWPRGEASVTLIALRDPYDGQKVIIRKFSTKEMEEMIKAYKPYEFEELKPTVAAWREIQTLLEAA